MPTIKVRGIKKVIKTWYEVVTLETDGSGRKYTTPMLSSCRRNMRVYKGLNCMNMSSQVLVQDVNPICPEISIRVPSSFEHLI